MTIPSREPCVMDPCRQTTNLHSTACTSRPWAWPTTSSTCSPRQATRSTTSSTFRLTTRRASTGTTPTRTARATARSTTACLALSSSTGSTASPPLFGVSANACSCFAPGTTRDDQRRHPPVDRHGSRRAPVLAHRQRAATVLDLVMDTTHHATWRVVALDGEPLADRLATHVSIPPGGASKSSSAAHLATRVSTRAVDTGPAGDPLPAATLADIVRGPASAAHPAHRCRHFPASHAAFPQAPARPPPARPRRP